MGFDTEDDEQPEPKKRKPASTTTELNSLGKANQGTKDTAQKKKPKSQMLQLHLRPP